MSETKAESSIPDVTLVAKRETSALSESGDSHSTTEFAALDPETHRGAFSRLSWAALLYAAGCLVAITTWLILQGETLKGTPRQVNIIAAGISVLLGVAVFLICRGRLIPVRLLTKTAFGFEILAAFGISGAFWGWEAYYTVDTPVTGLTWVCVWILVFPSIVPAAPRKTLVASLLAAVSVPLVMTLSVLSHGLPGDSSSTAVAQFIFTMSYRAFICAGLAYYTAILFHRLSRDASKARQMGSYQLVERIGAGGMGEVWKAKHRLLVRPAAIKLIRPDAMGQDEGSRHTATRRFEREAQATAMLRSPHTIELYDFGLTDDGTFYYVMELLEGLDLKTLVERHGPLPGQRVIHILRQACHSLHDAHASGMVHRDIKPANIFTCRRGQEFDFVKVLDFGLVAGNSSGDRGRTQLTVEGMLTGTPAFMAPEMVRDDHAVDHRVDIYALGCVGYWLLTGQLVFEAGTPLAMVVKHANELPQPPSVRTDMPIHPDLETVILACLQKNPDSRPQSACALTERLAEAAASVGVWTGAHAAEWWRFQGVGAGPRP